MSVCCPEFNRPGDCIGLCVNEPGQMTIQDARARAAERFAIDSAEFDAEIERLRYVEPLSVRHSQLLAETLGPHMRYARPTLIGTSLLALAALLHFSSDYMRYKPMTLTVLEEYLPAGGYKSPSSPVFVLRTADGRIFDTGVSFTTYHRFSKGDRIVMSLRRSDIDQSAWENALYFFSPLLLLIGGAALAIAGVVDWLIDCRESRRATGARE